MGVSCAECQEKQNGALYNVFRQVDVEKKGLRQEGSQRAGVPWGRSGSRCWAASRCCMVFGIVLARLSNTEGSIRFQQCFKAGMSAVLTFGGAPLIVDRWG